MMNYFAILLDDEAVKIIVYECADVGSSSFGALDGVYADLDVPTTRQ